MYTTLERIKMGKKNVITRDPFQNPEKCVFPSRDSMSIHDPKYFRKLLCTNYDKCLNIAVIGGWPSFTCRSCKTKNNKKALESEFSEEVSEVADLEEGLRSMRIDRSKTPLRAGSSLMGYVYFDK
jgi:hypothetical protein